VFGYYPYSQVQLVHGEATLQRFKLCLKETLDSNQFISNINGDASESDLKLTGFQEIPTPKESFMICTKEAYAAVLLLQCAKGSNKKAIEQISQMFESAPFITLGDANAVTVLKTNSSETCPHTHNMFFKLLNELSHVKEYEIVIEWERFLCLVCCCAILECAVINIDNTEQRFHIPCFLKSYYRGQNPDGTSTGKWVPLANERVSFPVTVNLNALYVPTTFFKEHFTWTSSIIIDHWMNVNGIIGSTYFLGSNDMNIDKLEQHEPYRFYVLCRKKHWFLLQAIWNESKTRPIYYFYDPLWEPYTEDKLKKLFPVLIPNLKTSEDLKQCNILFQQKNGTKCGRLVCMAMLVVNTTWKAAENKKTKGKKARCLSLGDEKVFEQFLKDKEAKSIDHIEEIIVKDFAHIISKSDNIIC
jgi:hypothetical protein